MRIARTIEALSIPQPFRWKKSTEWTICSSQLDICQFQMMKPKANRVVHKLIQLKLSNLKNRKRIRPLSLNNPKRRSRSKQSRSRPSLSLRSYQAIILKNYSTCQICQGPQLLKVFSVSSNLLQAKSLRLRSQPLAMRQLLQTKRNRLLIRRSRNRHKNKLIRALSPSLSKSKRRKRIQASKNKIRPELIQRPQSYSTTKTSLTWTLICLKKIIPISKIQLRAQPQFWRQQ